MRPVPGRLQLKQAASGAWIIDDSYNANPSSVRAGHRGARRDSTGRRWLVLGDMAELGEFAADAHAQIGDFAREHGIERLLATGPLAALAVERFGAGGAVVPRYGGADPRARRAQLPLDAAARRRPTCACWSRARASTGWSASSARSGRRHQRQPGRTLSALLARTLARATNDHWHTGFNVFSYLTFRAILATVSALAISLIVGPALIARLSRYQIGQVVRDDGPQTHLPKAGTPTMGGALILVTTLVSTLLWADLRNRLVWTVLGVTFAFGLIGFYDDYLKLVVRNPRGLAAALEVFLAVGGGPRHGGDALLHRDRRRRRRRSSCRSSRRSPRRCRRSASSRSPTS